ncbi:hypothetical protein HK100_007896 [Physocladia obscura]|uniref:Uncharacterized protein n=1 Tax=Physocladia obscura TaxID=109957 RepID=A0AAD5T526_9FUNG|nr:hypothetical protein HK100_007896 [Physocladia obscura]
MYLCAQFSHRIQSIVQTEKVVALIRVLLQIQYYAALILLKQTTAALLKLKEYLETLMLPKWLQIYRIFHVQLEQDVVNSRQQLHKLARLEQSAVQTLTYATIQLRAKSKCQVY